MPLFVHPNELQASLTAKLMECWPDFERQIPVRDVARALLDRPTLDRYSLPSRPLADLRRRLDESQPSPELRADYLKLLFIELLADLDGRIAARPLPESIRGLVTAEADRIADQLIRQPADFYDLDQDLFLKDLAILLLTLLPCGAELAQVRAGVPRSILTRGGIGQFLRGIEFFGVRTGGFEPFLSLHMDIRNLNDFTPEGWDRTYLRLADLLRLRPDFKGVFGTAWFYDPAMEWVSPHLAYLRRRRVEGGAAGFRYGPTESARRNALARSERRRTLHREGRYTPVSYYVVWSRNALLRWAERYPGENPAKEIR